MAHDNRPARTPRDAREHQQFPDRTAPRRRSVVSTPARNHDTMKLLKSVFLLLLIAAPCAAQKSLPAIRSQSDFDLLSVTYDANTPYALPHLIFVIDRKDNNKIYYVNKKRYSFHKDFVNGTYLSLERGREFFANNYLNPNRRFILGTIAYQTPVRRWTFEFWEGDLIPSDQIQLTYDIINKTFFTP